MTQETDALVKRLQDLMLHKYGVDIDESDIAALTAQQPAPAAAEPVAWEWFRDGKWEPCCWFVAHGFEGKLSSECRALYAHPAPSPAPDQQAAKIKEGK